MVGWTVNETCRSGLPEAAASSSRRISRQTVGSALTRPMAVGTLTTQSPLEARPGSFAGQLYEADVAHGQELGPGRIATELFGQGFVDRAPVIGLLHVDEIDDDDAAEIPEAKLPDNLDRRLEVERVDRFFQRLLADELPGVDVDRDQRFGLIDHQVTT